LLKGDNETDSFLGYDYNYILSFINANWDKWFKTKILRGKIMGLFGCNHKWKITERSNVYN
jgi:hypothetical protein